VRDLCVNSATNENGYLSSILGHKMCSVHGTRVRSLGLYLGYNSHVKLVGHMTALRFRDLQIEEQMLNGSSFD
jgi:hypothetical protein